MKNLFCSPYAVVQVRKQNYIAQRIFSFIQDEATVSSVFHVQYQATASLVIHEVEATKTTFSISFKVKRHTRNTL